jgi:hypothetical protein
VSLFRQLVGLLGRVIGPTQGLYLHIEQHNTEKRRYTSMPRAGFEPAISTFERPKTVLGSDRSAIQTGPYCNLQLFIFMLIQRFQNVGLQSPWQNVKYFIILEHKSTPNVTVYCYKSCTLLVQLISLIISFIYLGATGGIIITQNGLQSPPLKRFAIHNKLS